MKRYINRLTTALILCVAFAAFSPDCGVQAKGKKKATTTQTAKKQSTKNAASKGKTTGKKKKSTSAASKKSAVKKDNTPATAAEAKQQQQATEKEIRETREQIKQNEAQVRKNLGELGRLGGDIDASKVKVASIAGEVGSLDSEISKLEKEIGSNEAELARLRERYLQAIKKVRASRYTNSELAFVFSSDNFSQAMRRMRYLGQYSDWRKKQSAELDRRVGELKSQQKSLATARNEKNKALRRQQEAQNQLENQYARQDAIVVELKKNGEALRSHLQRKQAEANALGARVSSLIAQEQARAEAEARRKTEQEEARRRAEAAERERIEKERKAAAAETKATEPAKGKEAEPKAATDKTKEPKNQTSPAKQQEKNSGDYAGARKRKPRSDKPAEKSAPAAKAETPKPAAAAAPGPGGFEKMRGQLPRPVGGRFKVTSPFGRHPYPGLPDVMYDNLGIDAEVSAGAAVQSVYGGTVSAVFIMPDYQTVVMVNHGNYVTVYGHIGTASVKNGDVVKQGQQLGTLVADPDDPGSSVLHFEVWKNREKQDPMQWIR